MEPRAEGGEAQIYPERSEGSGGLSDQVFCRQILRFAQDKLA
jgi:hypothetical protein